MFLKESGQTVLYNVHKTVHKTAKADVLLLRTVTSHLQNIEQDLL
jgi:hypothetical protein